MSEADRQARPGPRRGLALGQRSAALLMRLFMQVSRACGRRFSSRFAGDFLRECGPFVPEHRLGLANLEAAYPDMAPEERARILSGVWDSLARVMVEYAFMPDLVDAFDPARPTGGVIEHVGLDHALRLRDSGKAAIVFGAHIGNWELPAALGARIGFPITALYRPPNNPFIAAEMERRRAFIDKLVASGRGAALQIRAALQKGRNVAIIVDQRVDQGEDILFFGRPARSNPVVGMLARHFDVPVIGARAVRLPGGRFRLEVTPPLDLPRDAGGRVDAPGANLIVHGLVERWVRETPDQWLWLHDRWRRHAAALRKR